MPLKHSTDLDKRLIHLLQVDFPLLAEPFAEIGRRLGVSETYIIRRIGELKREKIVRSIGPVLEARKLGYRTTLAALSVPPDNMVKAEQLISAHPSISHGYEREHRLNLWVTYAAPAHVDLDAEIMQLARLIGCNEAFSLPALRVFKIGAYFGLDSDDNDSLLQHLKQSRLPDNVPLSGQEKAVINALQQDLPLSCRPFTAMAESSGIKTGNFLKHCGSLLERGIMRRYSASINHRKAGYTANAMVCWLTPENIVEKAGLAMSTMRQVSHCYMRLTHPSWPYNLYTMLHARSREAAEELIDKLSSSTGLKNNQVLFSTRELKKNRINYIV